MLALQQFLPRRSQLHVFTKHHKFETFRYVSDCLVAYFHMRSFLMWMWLSTKNWVQHFCWIHFVQNIGSVRTKLTGMIHHFRSQQYSKFVCNICTQKMNVLLATKAKIINMLANDCCTQIKSDPPNVVLQTFVPHKCSCSLRVIYRNEHLLRIFVQHTKSVDHHLKHTILTTSYPIKT